MRALIEALHGRGFSDAEISEMSAEKMFEEYCTWTFGYRGWGPQLLGILSDARKKATTHPPTKEETNG